ncbi:MAG: TRAP transporter small permease subunit [Thermoanaerobacteraceae bacterium]|nr:TRAP transporter small permease subunit [Thermoanaerobacteraceae bacterium]
MERLMRTLDKIEAIVSMVLLGFLTILVFFSSLLRYLGYPINWSSTIASVIFVWVIYISADRALRKEAHLGVDLFTRRLPEKIQHGVSVAVLLIVLVFLILVAYVAVSLATAHTGRITEDLPISYSWVTSSVAVGAILMSVTLVAKLLAKFHQLRGEC